MLDRILIGSSAEPTDANFKNVTLLLHGDGSNGAQNNTFIDSSTNNFTITRNGNTTQGSFSPYGNNWSNYFDGSSDASMDYLLVSSTTALGFGTGDFTIELWFFTPAFGAIQTLIDLRSSAATAQPLTLMINSSGLARSYDSATRTGGQCNAGQWNHIAWVRASGVNTVYVNGAVGHTWTNGADYGSSRPAWIGNELNAPGSYPFKGYISNLRAVKGTAVYTSAFTPPTAPLTAITNTSLLTCADNRFRDGSTNNFTITRNGDVKVTNFAPFAPSAKYSTTTNGGSAFFDGSLNYLSTPYSNLFGFGTGDYTVEAWVYPTAISSEGNVIFAVFQSFSYAFYYTQSEVVIGRYTSSGLIATVSAGYSIPIGAWTHLAATRQGGTAKIYINGIEVFSGSEGTSYSPQAGLVGGHPYQFRNVIGFMSDVRVVTGTSIYTSNFTPPTSPVTAITNTSLLLKGQNAAIFDNSMKNDLETVGNAQISTSVKKFGTGSIYLSAYTAYLNSPFSQTAVFGTGDFTIEAWIYSVAATAGYTCIFSSRDGIASNANAVFFGLKPNTNQMTFFTSSEIIGTSTAISTGVWTHVALVRNSGATAIYINGVSSGTATFTTSLTGTGASIGNEYNQATGYNGGLYVDDLRITKGVARYTANFTAPTAPFPNK